MSQNEELNRVIPVIKELKKQFPDTLISIDSFRSEVVRQAYDYGANIINDVSGGNLDQKMFELVAQLKIPYILMHMRGTPATMKQLTEYRHLIKDVVFELSEKIKKLRQLGVNDIIVDPGFGFAKTIHQNYKMIENLNYFHHLDCPLLVGISRKSMIYKLFDGQPSDALNGTIALNMLALDKGAHILRVHDVKPAKELVEIYKQLKN